MRAHTCFKWLFTKTKRDSRANEIKRKKNWEEGKKTIELVCYGNFCHCWDSPISCVCVCFFFLFVSFEKSSLLFACDDENDWLTRILFLDQSANLTSYLIGNSTEICVSLSLSLCMSVWTLPGFIVRIVNSKAVNAPICFTFNVWF